MKRVRAALILLTRLPVSGEGLVDEDFRAATPFFPWVGVIVGVIAAFAFALGAAVDGLVGGLFALAACALVTGALHEDGLADCADAFLGTRDEQRAREVLKDPRLGTFAFVALFVVLSLRVGLLPDVLEHAMAALVLAATLGRFAMLFVARALPYVGSPETQKTGPVDPPTPRALVLAGLAPAVVAGLAWSDHRVSLAGLVVACALCAGVVAFMVRLARQRLGGWVGDVLGATEQLAELATLAGLAFFPVM